MFDRSEKINSKFQPRSDSMIAFLMGQARISGVDISSQIMQEKLLKLQMLSIDPAKYYAASAEILTTIYALSSKDGELRQGGLDA